MNTEEIAIDTTQIDEFLNLMIKTFRSLGVKSMDVSMAQKTYTAGFVLEGGQIYSRGIARGE